MAFSFFKLKSRPRQSKDSVSTAAGNRERSSNPQVSIKLAEHFLREKKQDLAVDEYLNAAQAFLEKRQTQLAMAVYRNIITIAPERYGVYETLADLYRMSGFPGDGASVLLALAYQYKKAGRDSEVRRILDTVLEYAPDNPVLKRKVQAFFAAQPTPAAPASPRARKETTPAAAAPAAPVPEASAPADTIPVPETLTQAPAPVAAQPAPAASPPGVPADVAVPYDEPPAPVVPDVPAVPVDSAQTASPDVPAAEATDTARPFDLRSALEDDFPEEPDAAVRQDRDDDATAQSFFDLQSVLTDDPTLRFDVDAASDDLSDGEQEGSLFSVLNVVKGIAAEDPRQDTPQFHFQLGVAYMQCADYEQAVDELLSALYGIPDKIGCYVRLAECSLKLHRRELASGFLREALDHPEISPDQAAAIRQRLDEIGVA